MLTDWLIFLDYLEENNCNTSFLRLVTPIIFNANYCHNYSYDNNEDCMSFDNGNSGDASYYSFYNGYGLGNGNGYGCGHGYGNYIYGNGIGYGFDNYATGNGYGIGQTNDLEERMMNLYFDLFDEND